MFHLQRPINSTELRCSVCGRTYDNIEDVNECETRCFIEVMDGKRKPIDKYFNMINDKPITPIITVKPTLKVRFSE